MITHDIDWDGIHSLMNEARRNKESIQLLDQWKMNTGNMIPQQDLAAQTVRKLYQSQT